MEEGVEMSSYQRFLSFAADRERGNQYLLLSTVVQQISLVISWISHKGKIIFPNGEKCFPPFMRFLSYEGTKT